MDIISGSPAPRAARFPRPDLEDRLFEAVTEGAGVKMFGLRRTGKSTLRLATIERLMANGHSTLFVDGQGIRSIHAFLARLMAEMPQGDGWLRRAASIATSAPAQAALAAIVQGSEIDSGALAAYWTVVAAAVRRAIEEQERGSVLVIDEFAYLIDNIAKDAGPGEADKLLAAMREWRGAGLAMLLTGSIGLSAVLRTHGLPKDHLNDLEVVVIPELSDTEAREFILRATQISSNGRWTEAHTDALMREVGCLYPAFLVSGLRGVRYREPIAPELFAATFAADIRPRLNDTFYDQFDRRFEEYEKLPDAERDKLLLPALVAIMDANIGCDQAALPCPEPYARIDLDGALRLLHEDGFVTYSESVEGDRIWLPGSRLVRLWWKRAGLVR